MSCNPGAVQLSAEEAARGASSGAARLLQSRRLVLVLDLDHTLLNSAKAADVSEGERQALIRQHDEQEARVAAYHAAQHQQPSPEQQDAQASPSSEPAGNQPSDPAVDFALQQQQQEQEPEQQPSSSAAAGQANGQQRSTLPADDSATPSTSGPVQRTLFHLFHGGLWTKLRPGLHEFLEVGSLPA
jgi:hypothetical protein